MVWNNTHTGQPASFTALTEFLRENIRLWLLAHPKIPSLPGIPTWVLFILYRLFITQITVSTCKIHDNRWKFIYNRYKVFFSVICNLAYCVYIFLPQILGQIKKKTKNCTVTQIIYLIVSVWHLQMQLAAGTVSHSSLLYHLGVEPFWQSWHRFCMFVKSCQQCLCSQNCPMQEIFFRVLKK